MGDRAVVRGVVGTIRFIGETKFAAGVWCGIELDDPIGKNDGSVQGVLYFKPQKEGLYGIFGRIETVQEATKEFKEPKSHEDRQLSSVPIGNTMERQKLESIISKLQEKLYIMHKTCESMQMELEKHQDERILMKEYEKNLEATILEKDTIEAHCDELANKLEHLKDEHENALAELFLLREEVILRREIEDEELSKMDVNPGDVWKRNKIVESTLLKLQASLETSSELNKKLENENMLLLEENEQLTHSFLTMSSELDGSKILIESLNSQFKSDVVNDEIIDSLTSKNIALTEELESLRKSLKEINSTQAVEEDLKKLYNDLEEELSNQLQELHTTVENDRETIEVLRGENERLQGLVDSRLHTHSSPKAFVDIENLTEQLKRLKYINRKLSFEKEFLESGIGMQHDLGGLSAQATYLSQKIFDNCMRGTLELKYIMNFILRLLACILNSLNRDKREQILEEPIIKGFLAKAVQLEKTKDKMINDEIPNDWDVDELRNFIDSVDFLNKDAQFFKEFMFYVFSEYIPNLLAELNKDGCAMGALQDVYSVVKLIEKAIQCNFSVKDVSGHELILERNSSMIEYIYWKIVHPLATMEKDNIDFDTINADASILLKQISTVRFTQRIDKKISTSDFWEQDIEDYLKKEVENYEHSLQHLKKSISKKDALIEELSLKIKVLEGKALRNLEQEATIKGLEEELSKLKAQNFTLQSDLEILNGTVLKLNDSLKEAAARDYYVFPSNDTLKISKEVEKISKLDLISEVTDLRRTIKCLLTEQSTSTDIGWIEEDLQPHQRVPNVIFQNRLNSLYHMMLEHISNASVVPIRRPSKDKNRIRHARHYCYQLKEENARVDAYIRELAIN